jgi:uncharacterized membrane protein
MSLTQRELEALGRDDPLWPGQLATTLALALLFALPRSLTLGPNWLLPGAVFLMLAGLVVAAHTGRGVERRREVAIGLALFAVAASLVALGLLVDSLLNASKASANDLLLGGVLIWTTNVLLFAVVYWELDRGGPLNATPDRMRVDFLFAQMGDERFSHWTPTFGDYLYLSLTNQTAFSPTDTLPLTKQAKFLMGVQSVAAIATVGVIVAHAVNVLA